MKVLTTVRPRSSGAAAADADAGRPTEEVLSDHLDRRRTGDLEGDLAPVGMLQWSARSEDTEIHDGADSYLVRDGLIVAQTIHYSVR